MTRHVRFFITGDNKLTKQPSKNSQMMSFCFTLCKRDEIILNMTYCTGNKRNHVINGNFK